MDTLLENKNILITGGTGSLGTALVRRIITGEFGMPNMITIYSRDESKQHSMSQKYVGFNRLNYKIGDVRDYPSVLAALNGTNIIFNTAAMKHVYSCQQNPFEAVLTNVIGTQNIIRAIREFRTNIEAVVGISSDKGCHPVNVYGATKFLQEKLLLQANCDCPNTRFISVCYGNVMASRGSVIPIFQRQVQEGGPVTVTNPQMTRFLISLDHAVDTIMAALKYAHAGEVYVPVIPAATVGDLAKAFIRSRNIPIRVTGKSPGEKMDEILITSEECEHTVRRNGYYVITPEPQARPALSKEYCSKDYLIGLDALINLLAEHKLLKQEMTTV